MKIWLCLAALPLAGCYTQLYTRGYAERSVYGYPYGEPAARDSAYADSASLPDSVAAADSARRPPNTVIVNNYYQDRPYYRGYAIEDWDYPYVSFGFYSGRYRDFYGPYWWHDPYYHRGWRPRHYETYPGGGGGSSGPYHSDKRIFAPAPSQPPLHKGRRSEPAQAAPAPKAADPAPAESSRSSSSNDDNSASGSSGSSSSGSSSGSSGSGDDHPDLHKGRRR